MRYKEFNRNNVLEKCIPLFWATGFRACAISDIVEETGVNRFSLYEEFDNKEGILYAALELYKERYAQINFDILKKEGNPHEILFQFFNSFLNGKQQDGCFIMHVGTELADNDEKVKAFLKNYMDELEQLFTQLMDNNSETKLDSAFYARNLVGLFCTSISFCLIHSVEERERHIKNGIQVILNKKLSYA